MVSDFQAIPEGEALASSPANPFAVTKAVDFTDQEIQSFWVDIPIEGGLLGLARPRAPMPMLITGGKGSGKTHLMRYMSASAQKLRHGNDLGAAITADGYLGVYVRLSGLNASRFRGKQQSNEAWEDVFAYYMELWIGQHLLTVIHDTIGKQDGDAELLRELTQGFTDDSAAAIGTVSGLSTHLNMLQRSVDHAVNNSSLSGSLEVEVNLNRGSLIFGIPRALSNQIQRLRNCPFLYLFDEFENLDKAQQKYINTLVREKEPPASFRIGARSYGIRTYATLSAQEEIKEGSEFERLRLDDKFRKKGQTYSAFLHRLIARRLEQRFVPPVDPTALQQRLEDFFEDWERDSFLTAETQFVIDNFRDTERPYFDRLKKKLAASIQAQTAPGLSSIDQVDQVVETLRVPDKPLVEKINLFLLFRAWSRGKPLEQECKVIQQQASLFVSKGSAPRHDKVAAKFKLDLLAQLLRECGQKQHYYGLDTFIGMSAGLPRNLLVILKHVFSWAEFLGESPFSSQRISFRAQERGVLDASQWFLADARIPGPTGTAARRGVERLGTLFREIRFSDKPSECSLATFSVCKSDLDSRTRTVLDKACEWSLLLEVVGGQKDKNSKRVDDKYQINPMLAPIWQLPTSRRGTIALSPREVTLAFEQDSTGDFDQVVANRVARMNAPFKRTAVRPTEPRPAQVGLFDPDDT